MTSPVIRVKGMVMAETELLMFKDQLRNSLASISGVALALSYVRDESTDYCMSQMLSDVLKDQINGIVSACPEEWGISQP